ncbi:MAG: hypothetical protein ACLQU5_03125, partial [Isosphaeraceae bacterium]
AADVAAFESLLGAKIVSTEVLSIDSDRLAYLACGSSCGHLFLDPDTGLRMRSTRGIRAPEYLFAAELLRLAEQRPGSLTIVFDQSVGRGSERLHLEGKLRELRHHSVFGFAYVSHACFVVASPDRGIVDRARSQVISRSRLPESRFLPVDPPNQALHLTGGE